MPSDQTPTCIQCGKDDSQVPLFIFEYQGAEMRICSEHFPTLIHNPAKLSGKLSDAENITPGEHD